MGAANVARAFAVWGHLPDREFRVLALMALTSLDDDNGKRAAREYFGGRDHLAFALGRDPDTDPEAHRTVKRAIQALVKAGAVERTTHAHSGNRQVYRLNLGNPEPVDNFLADVIPITGKGGHQMAPRGGH